MWFENTVTCTAIHSMNFRNFFLKKGQCRNTNKHQRKDIKLMSKYSLMLITCIHSVQLFKRNEFFHLHILIEKKLISFNQLIFKCVIILYLLFLFNFEVRHPRCVGSITKNFCVLHNTVEYNYISPSSTVGIQLHVSALYVGHLQVVI